MLSKPNVDAVRISHADRLIYPDLGISKIQLARYFEQVGDWILPHVAGRPLTLLHCPGGAAVPCHYLKHAKAWGPNALRRVRIQEKTKVGEYLVADSVDAVISLAQMGLVEIRTWNSTTENLERPNRLVWDLDPGAGDARLAIVGEDHRRAWRACRRVHQGSDLECGANSNSSAYPPSTS